MRVVPIVEGHGDLKAVPALIGMLGAQIELQIFSDIPIRAGEWPKIKRTGELERLLTLASTRGADRILVVLDMDDDCPVTEYNHAMVRVENWKNGRNIDVGVAFLYREFETLFLHQYEKFKDNRPNLPVFDNEPEFYRGAKGLLKRVTGRRYKETEDQILFTKRLDLPRLYSTSRSFRKLAKEICGLDDEDLGNRLQIE